MKIVYTGGGTGGHFTPIIAVAQEINREIDEQKIIGVEQYFISDAPLDERALFENGITFVKIDAGKRRTYFSIRNFFDIFKTIYGVLQACMKMFNLYPDVVFSKGGYSAFPTLMAARLLRIPVVVHESDSVPGRVGVWSGKFAERVAIAFPEAATYFPKGKVALVGIPIRKEIREPVSAGAHEFLHLERDVPTIMIYGGSQGSQIINDAIIDIIPQLVEKYQVIHQVGKLNYTEARGRAEVVLQGNPNEHRYRMFDYLNETAIRMTAGIADLAVTRAGGTSLYEFATWKIPTIIIPITESQGDHQRRNAYSFARAGAGIVIEEKNLTSNILLSEINRLMDDPEQRAKIKKAEALFALPDAAKKIATELLAITLAHQ